MVRFALNFSLLILLTLQVQAQTSLSIKVNKSGNDAEVFSDNKTNFSSGDLELHGKDGSKLQESFVRFEGITIADLAAVTSVHLEFYAATSSTAASQITIKGEVGNSLAYPTSTSATTGAALKARAYTTQSVVWNTTGATANQKQTSPDLKPLLTAMMAGSINNGNLAFRLIGNTLGSFNMLSFNGSTAQAPTLVFNYGSDPGGGTGGNNGVESDPANMTQLFINEISAEGTLLDADGDDWIELYNNHDYPIALNGGVFISDKKTNLFLHELTGITIPAKGFYTLLANDKEELGPKNLPFEVKNGGEKVFLTRIASGIAMLQDTVDTPDIDFNESFGRLPNGTGTWVRFITPSYNANNANGAINVPVDFSHKRGLHHTSFNLTVTIPPGTTARYTTNGKTPSKTVGTIYSGPIPITKNTMIKLYAYGSGTENSGVRVHTYFIEDKYNVDNEEGWIGSSISEWENPNKLTAAEYIQSLRKYPIVSIGSDTDPTTTTIKTVTVEYIDKHLDAENDNYVTTAGCSEFGQTTIGLESANLKLRFKTDYKSRKIDYNIFDEIDGEKYEPTNYSGELDLKEGSDTPHRSSYSSSGEGITKFNDYFMFNIMKRMGAWAPATKFVHCYINGKYHGLKTLREGFDPRNLENYFGDDDDNYSLINLQDGDHFLEGDVAQGPEALWDQLREDIEDENYQAVKNRVEIEDYIRVSMLFLMFDTEAEAKTIGHNLMPQYSKFRFILSDNDGALWNKRLFECHNYRYKWNLNCGMAGPAEILGYFTGAKEIGVSNTKNYAGNVGNLEFKTKLKDEILRHMQTPGGVLTVPVLNTFLDSIRSHVALGIKMDVAYLGNEDNYNNWNNDVTRYKNEMQARFNFTLEKWTQKALTHTLLPASINTNDEIPAETPITMVNPNANTTLYYTIDGSDPMGNDGAVSPLAMVYTNPISLPSGTYTIVTRAFKTLNWGPLTHKAVKVSGTIGNKSSDDDNTDFMTENRSEDNENALDFAESVSIYPNPVYGEMHLDFKEMPAAGVEFLLYDQSGKLQLANSLRSTSNTIPTFYLQAGNYYGVLSGGGVKHTFSVVKR